MTMPFFTKLTLAFAATALLAVAPAAAASKEKINRKSDRAVSEFRETITGADAVLNKAAGYLVFPSIKKAGIGIGGEHGKGALRVGGKTVAYYSTTSASIGFQLGAQARRQIIVFLDQKALDKFRASQGWEIGVDASVAVVTIDAGGAVDATQLNQPIVAFVFDGKGLMYNLSLEGSKINQIKRD